MDYIEKLEWDSRFLKLNVFKVEEFSDIEKFKIEWKLKQNLIDLAYYETYMQNNNYMYLQEMNFIYVLTKVEFEIENISGEDVDFVQRCDSRFFDDEIYDLANQLSKYSRFYKDVHFKKNEAYQLYIKWIEKAFWDETYDTFIYKEETVSGFIIVKIEDKDTIRIDLLAVDKKVKRKGIGSKLIQFVFNYYKKKGFKNCKVVTQSDNLDAILFYQKCGFKLIQSQAVFHYWNLKEGK